MRGFKFTLGTAYDPAVFPDNDAMTALTEELLFHDGSRREGMKAALVKVCDLVQVFDFEGLEVVKDLLTESLSNCYFGGHDGDFRADEMAHKEVKGLKLLAVGRCCDELVETNSPNSFCEGAQTLWLKGRVEQVGGHHQLRVA